MKLTRHDAKLISPQKPNRFKPVYHEYADGTITARQIADRLGLHIDTVHKRLRNQSADELLAEGRRKSGCKPGWNR